MSPPSPEMRAHCSIGKTTCLAFLPWPKQHESTFQLLVQVWTANISSLLHHILLMKIETGSSVRKQKCFSLSKKPAIADKGGLGFNLHVRWKHCFSVSDIYFEYIVAALSTKMFKVNHELQLYHSHILI